MAKKKASVPDPVITAQSIAGRIGLIFGIGRRLIERSVSETSADGEPKLGYVRFITQLESGEYAAVHMMIANRFSGLQEFLRSWPAEEGRLVFYEVPGLEFRISASNPQSVKRKDLPF